MDRRVHELSKKARLVLVDLFHRCCVAARIRFVLIVGRLAVNIGLVLFVKIRPSFPFGAILLAKQGFHSGWFSAAVGEICIPDFAAAES